MSSIFDSALYMQYDVYRIYIVPAHMGARRHFCRRGGASQESSNKEKKASIGQGPIKREKKVP